MSSNTSPRAMGLRSTNFSSRPAVFVPNVLRLPGTNAKGSARPACPTRHSHDHPTLTPFPPILRPPTIAVHSRQATSKYQPTPSIINVSQAASLQTIPLVGAPSPQLGLPSKPTDASNALIKTTSVPQRRGHRHSKESRKKIGIANRGNVPWNKGRKHSEETKRKIAENTRRAMLRPEMRQILQQRAKGRRHSEATKLKIRETARLTRGTVKSAERRNRKSPVPFSFAPDVVRRLNDCVATQIEKTFEKDEQEDASRYIVHEKRVVSRETREKLSQRIKEMWNDPNYRSRVASGVQERYKRLSEQKKTDHSTEVSENQKTEIATFSTKRRPRSRTRQDTCQTQGIKRTRQTSASKRSAGDVDIVLDADSLKGWTKEDLGIIGTHGAGRIDEDIMGKLGQDEWSFQQDQESFNIPGSPGPQGLLQSVEASDGIYTSCGDVDALSPELVDPGLTNPFASLANELDFSQLDIRTESAPGRSAGNQTNLFDESLNSFSHEEGSEGDVEPNTGRGIPPQHSRSVIEQFEHNGVDKVDNRANIQPQSLASYHSNDDPTVFESF